MNQPPERGRDTGAPSRTERVHADTGLSAGQQDARRLLAQAWAARVIGLMQIAGCDVRLALKAVADADTEHDQ